MAERRAWWQVQQAGLDPERLVFIDETWAKTNMTRPRGRSRCGTRLVDKSPHGHWKTTTFVAALRTSGLTAPLVLDGAINGNPFLVYHVRQVLVPTLRTGRCGGDGQSVEPQASGCARSDRSCGRPQLLYARRTVPTSIPSSWPSQNSNGCCGPPPNARSKPSGAPVANFSTASPNTSAATTSDTAATATIAFDAL